MDHLTALCEQIFIDSKIASNLTMGRTKTAAIVKNVLRNKLMKTKKVFLKTNKDDWTKQYVPTDKHHT